MRKFLIILFTLCIITFDCIADTPTLWETKQKLNHNPIKIAQWLRKNIRYELEFKEYIQTPEETFDKKTGDCEDYAILAEYLMGNSYPSQLIGYFPNDVKSPGHCIYVFRFNRNVYGCIDMGSYYIGTSLGAIVKKSSEGLCMECPPDRVYVLKFAGQSMMKIRVMDLGE